MTPVDIMRGRLRLAPAAVLALVALAAAAAVAQPARARNPWDLCAAAVSEAERAAALPVQMLQAVSLAEAGRWHAGRAATIAWPWTVTAGGEGKFFPTKADAVAHVARLQKAGRRNIDVGCLQVNLAYHPEAFDGLDAALDPERNAAYAAAFLSDLLAESRSWALALARYHSRERKAGRAYSKKVFAIWNAERRRRYEEERLARIAAYRARTAARLAEAEDRRGP